MSKSTHQFEIKGIDKSAGAFASISKSAKVTSAQIRAMVGGAIAGLGTYFTFGAINSGVDELGKLSDIAQKSRVSVDELTKAATAFGVVGVRGMEVDQIGKAFDHMARATGRQGMEGFFQTVTELAKIPDVAERGKEAIRIFGKSGMEFMPLINGAKNGVAAIRSVIDTMPGVTQAAADAGDNLADAKLIGADGFKSIWLNAIGAVCKRFGYDFRGGAAAMVAYVDYGCHVAWRHINSLFDKTEHGASRLGEAWGAIGNAIVRNIVTISAVCYEYMKTIPERLIAGVAGGLGALPGIFSSKWREQHAEIMGDWFSEISQNMWLAVDRDLKEIGIDINKDSLKNDIQSVFKDITTNDLEAKLESALKKAKSLSENVANSVGEGLSGEMNDKINSGNIGNIKNSDFSIPQKINIHNDLVYAGSNASTRLQILGPSLQNETKKQTEILTEISNKIGKVADGIGAVGAENFDLLDA